jgi:ribosomal protein S18 acetylase RimI-like enzyme
LSEDTTPSAEHEPISVRPFQEADRAAVIDLWYRCNLVVPWNDPDLDISRKLHVRPEWFLVGTSAGRVIATLMVGYEGHRGWLNYLAVDPTFRRQGIGRLLVAHAEEILREAGCPKICLQVRTGNTAALEFYGALDFSRDDVVGLGKRLVDDRRDPAP